jgi:hypothetical protein
VCISWNVKQRKCYQLNTQESPGFRKYTDLLKKWLAKQLFGEKLFLENITDSQYHKVGPPQGRIQGGG